MIKTVLLILLYNLSTGQVVSVYEQDGRLPGYESQEQCEQAVKEEVPNLEASLTESGYGLKALCVTAK